jgi:hypothetical protein
MTSQFQWHDLLPCTTWRHTDALRLCIDILVIFPIAKRIVVTTGLDRALGTRRHHKRRIDRQTLTLSHMHTSNIVTKSHYNRQALHTHVPVAGIQQLHEHVELVCRNLGLYVTKSAAACCTSSGMTNSNSNSNININARNAMAS